MSTVYEKLIPPARRYELEVLVLQKPQGRYIAPTAQAVGNYVGGIFAALSFANRRGYTLPTAQETQLENVAKQYAEQALDLLGITVNFDATQTAGSPLSLSTQVQKGTSSTSFTFTFAPVAISFRPNHNEMKALAVTRYQRYIQALTDGDVQKIFDLAAMGYQQFLSGDTAAEIKAKLKHRLAMERVKAAPAEYRSKLSHTRYQDAYDVASARYEEAFQNIGGPAILYGFEFAKAVLTVI